MRQDAISRILSVTTTLDDALDEDQLTAVQDLIALIEQPLSRADIETLVSLLPSGGDSAHGLNWAVLHTIEAAPLWPLWDVLADIEHEWVEVLIARIRNGDHLASS